MVFDRETELIEFKETTGELSQAVEAIAAMLNKSGHGEVYFGVNDKGEVKGQPISDQTVRNVTDTIMRDIEPVVTPTVEVPSYDGKTVLKVSFSGNQKPYSAYGKYLIRVGTQNRRMTRDELRRLIKDEDYSIPWEKEKSEITIDDIDDDALRKYYSEAVTCGRLNMPVYDKKNLLTILDLYHEPHFNNAAFALFGRDANIGLKTACYATDEKITFTDINAVKGNIYNLINSAELYISNHINWWADIQLKRIEIPEIPVQAYREIIVNAFAHAIYVPTPEIEVDIFPGRISITNPGSFPDDLTPEDFITTSQPSIKRNPLILDVLYRCKDVEKSGTGFRRMNELCENAGVKWSFSKFAYSFMFSFKRKSSSVYSIQSLGQEEQTAYMIIKNNPRISREALATALGMSVRTSQRITESLTEKGYIMKVGNNRYSYWKISDKD